MQRPARASFVALFLIATAASPAVAQDEPRPAPKHMVRFSFKEGTVRHSKIVQEVSMKMNMGGNDMDTEIKMTMWITTTVKSTKGNVAQIEQVITRVKAVSSGNGMVQKFDFDSDDPDSDAGPMYTMSDLVGQKVRFKLTDAGKQSDVELPKTGDNTNRNVEGMQQSLLQGLTQLPEHPIAIGDKWQNKGKSKMAMLSPEEVMVTTETELRAIDKESITVRQKQTVENDNQQGAGAALAQDIDMGGTYKLDLRTGVPIEATALTKTKMKGPLKVDMTIKQTIAPAPAPKKAKKPAKVGK